MKGFVRVSICLLVASALVGCSGSRIPTPPLIQPEDSAPSWSADGQSIAYVHFNPNANDTTEPSGLYVVDAAGTTKRLIVPGFYGGSLARSVDWSPDSRWLVYNNDTGIHAITAAGESLRTINSGGSFPSWSPEGDRVAFDANGQVWTINIDGTGLTEVPLLPNSGMRDPDWSPNGDRLVVLLYLQGTSGSEIYTLDLDGTDGRRLTTDGNEDRSPAWSPRGDLIAWNPWPRDSRGNEGHEIWVMDTLGTSRRKLATTVSAPSWNPAGTAIVFSDQASGAIRLFVINVDGTGLRQLTR